MLKRVKLYFGLLLMLCCFAKVSAQSFVLKNYTTSDGLPSSETYFTAQDSKGYLWVTTDRGMAKFDGYKFTTYSTEDGLSDNTNFQFVKDAKNRLWFSGFSSQIGFIENDSIYSYKYNDSIKRIKTYNFIDNFIVDASENLWISKFAEKRYGIDNVNYITKINKSGIRDTTYNFFKKGYQRVYINRKGESVQTGDIVANYTDFFTLEDKKFITQIKHPTNLSKVKTGKINDTDYISILGSKIVLFNRHKKTDIWECKNNVIQLFVDGEKNIWIGYRDDGYDCLLAKDNYKKAISGLSGLTVSSISQDNEGGTWITTIENGVYYLSPQRFIVYNDEHGLKNKKITKVINVRDNVLAVDVEGKVFMKEQKKAFFEEISHPTDNKRINVFNILYDEKYGLYTFNPLNRIKYLKMERLMIPNIIIGFGFKAALGERYLWVINANLILKSDKLGNGLDTIDCKQLARVWSVCEVGEDEVLIGTLNGLYHYKGGKIIDLKKKNPLFRYRVNDLMVLNNNYVLAGTIGGGILVIEKNNLNNVRQLKDKDGLPSLMCGVIAHGKGNSVWVGTNKGLCHISNILDSTKTRFTTVSVDNGLVANEVTGITLINDKVWASTIGGISVIKNDGLNSEIKNIPIYIKKVSSQNRDFITKQKAEIKYNNSITISYVGISLQNSKNLRYKYRLKNKDDKWSYTQNLSVVYSALPPGDYTFEVGVEIPNKYKKNNLATFNFIVLPPFWQTNWFIAITTSLILLCAALIIRRRINFVRDQERLKQSLRTFRDKALRSQMNPHFIYNSLNAIQNYILKHEIDSSATYLTKFSRLMRLTFNNTAEELVSLEKEIEALKIYAELENLRFDNKFDLHITFGDGVEERMAKVPPLIMQPFIENAIIHGISGKEGRGNIWVDVTKKNNRLEITIKDDGKGLEHSKKVTERKSRFNPIISAKGTKKHSGIKTTEARIQQIWGKDYHPEYFRILDINKTSQQTGTLIIFYLPYYD